ncbi:MAG: hypothetical protein ABSG31_00065 [Tepidisphaeraceae bacterium]|jgi:hypothetical protein
MVATLLGAGRLACAAPMQGGPAVAQFTGRMMARLSRTAVRVMPAARVYQTRQPVAEIRQCPVLRQSAPPVRVCLDPFQFRLPPPTA